MRYASTSKRPTSAAHLILRAALLASSLLALVGCGHKPPTSSAPDPLRAARAFAFDYAKWRSGDLRPNQIRAASRPLAARLSRQRVPLGSSVGSISVVDVRIVRADAQRAVAQLTLRSSPEQLSFTSDLVLRSNRGAWSVSSLR